MRKSILAFATAGAVALTFGALHAQGGGMPGTMDVSKVTAGTYKLDPNHTLVGWKLNHLGFSDYFGIFGNITGTLEIDPAHVEATKLDVTVPINPTLASQGLHDHLLRPGKDGGKPDFFGASPAPAHFVSTAVKKTGATSADITGNLTMNGVTKPVTIHAKLHGAGNSPMNKKLNVGFSGTATIKRSDWGLSTALPMVSDEVQLEIAAPFEKQ